MKILERFVDNNLINRISKGVYWIVGQDNLNQNIEYTYIADLGGMYVGYKMYNELGVSAYECDEINILTGRITTKTKRIANLRLRHADLLFSPPIVRLIRALECLQNYHKIIDVSGLAVLSVVKAAASIDLNLSLSTVLQEIKYSFSTIKRFSDILNQLGIKNDAIEIYEKHYA